MGEGARPAKAMEEGEYAFAPRSPKSQVNKKKSTEDCDPPVSVCQTDVKSPGLPIVHVTKVGLPEAIKPEGCMPNELLQPAELLTPSAKSDSGKLTAAELKLNPKIPPLDVTDAAIVPSPLSVNVT